MHHPPPGHHSQQPVGANRAKALAATVAVVAVGLIVLAFVQSAFGTGSTTTPATQPPAVLPAAKKTATATPSPTRTTPRPAGTTLTREQREAAFVLLVQTRRAFRDIGGDDLLRLGRAACKAMDAGASIQGVALTLVAEGNVGPEDAGYLVGSAIHGLCPRHKGKIRG